MTDELRPCPYCGGKAEEYYESWVCCSDEHIQVNLTKDEWNTRPIEDALRKQHIVEMAAKVEALEWRDKEICTLRKQLDEDQEKNRLIVEVITAMYDQVHEERDALRAKLDVAVKLLKNLKPILDKLGYGIGDTLAEIEKIGVNND